MARLNIKDVAGTRPFNICGVRMIEMMDYKKYSVHEYNTILRDWYYGKPPEDTNIFKYSINHVKRNVDNMLIMFDNNHWLKVDSEGWWAEAYSDDTRDVISNRHFYTKNRTSESLGLGNIAFTSRPAKGITYKNIVLKGVNITRNDHTIVRVNCRNHYHFNTQQFKKYKEIQFNTNCGLSYFEKINNKNEVLKTVIRVSDKESKDTYSCNLEWDRNRNVVNMQLYKNFQREKLFPMKFKDCSIDNIFNKYIMFEFELITDQKNFEALENVRTLLKKHIQNTYTKVKEDGLNTTLISHVLKRIEVIESDEHQVQRRP